MTADQSGTGRRERVVLGFTGDLDTTVAVHWLAEAGGVDVVALIADFGQSRDLEDIRDRALALGALRAHVLDVREEFTRAYLLPAVRAGALGDGRRLDAALGHAAVAGKLVEIAAIEQTDCVAHGGVAGAARIAAAVHALRPGFRVLAPACEWGMDRDALVEYAAMRRLRLPLPGAIPPVRAFPRGHHETEAAVVEVTFTAGLPVALNGVAMPLLDLIGSLDFLAGKHGLGRRESFETPAVAVLAAAHADLRQRVAAPELTDFTRTVGRQYARLVEDGCWFSVLRSALDAYVDRAEQGMNGVVRARLCGGVCDIVDRRITVAQEDDDDAVVGAFRYRA